MADATQQAWWQNPALWGTIGQLALGAYNTFKTPQYKQTPLSPEMSSLYQHYISAFDNPATKYNAGLASDLARSEIPRLGPTMPWNRSNVFNMAFMGLTPPTKPDTGANTDYYKNLIASSMANQAGAQQQPATAPPGGLPPVNSGPGDIAGDPFGHLSAPAGSENDPFAKLPTGMNPKEINTWDDIKALGPVALQVAMSMTGLPGMTFSKIASYISGKFGSSNDPLQGKAIPTIKGKAYEGYDPALADNFLLRNDPVQKEKYNQPYTGTQEPVGSASTGLPGGSYDAYYGGGGGGPDFDTRRMIRNGPYRGLLGVGQRV